MSWCRRCLVYHTPGPNGGTFRFINDPTIGDIRHGRERGAFLLRRVVERRGNRLYGAWFTDEGRAVVVWESEVRDAQVPEDKAHQG